MERELDSGAAEFLSRVPKGVTDTELTSDAETSTIAEDTYRCLEAEHEIVTSLGALRRAAGLSQAELLNGGDMDSHTSPRSSGSPPASSWAS